MRVEVDIYKDIRSSFIEGESQRHIAQRLGIARQTVKKYCEGATHPDERKPYQRRPEIVTEDITNFILKCLQEDQEENLKKQKHTSKRIFDRLVDEKDFLGAESTIRRVVREIKGRKSVPPQAIVPLSYEPGEAIQIDWGEVTVYLNDEKLKLYIFCARLCYSCDIFVQVFKAANEEAFLEAQQRMFDYFSGVPQRVIFDNAKVAVKEGFGLHAKPQDKYLSFSAHYAFDLDFCNPGKGNEKSLVENLVGYSRRNFLVPVPRITSVEELNIRLLDDCLKYRQKHKVESRNHPVSILYAEELRHLNAIAPYRFDTSKTVLGHVDDYSTVRFDKNNYSVPVKFLRQTVTVKGFGNDIRVLHQNKVIASYDRAYSERKTFYKLEHYIDLLERKPRSIFNARPVKETLEKVLLDWGKQLPGGNKEMVKLLRLCVDYGTERIVKIKNMIPCHVVPTVDMIRSHLNEPTESSVIYLSNEIGVDSVDLTQYDKKYGMAVHE